MLFLNPLILWLSCFDSEFQPYSMKCGFTGQSLLKQWCVLELQVRSYHLSIGQGRLNIALIM